MKTQTIITILFSLLITSTAFAQIGNKIYFKRRPMEKALTPRISAKLVYIGGPVISNVKLVAVFWGDNVDGNVKGGIGGFYSALSNSTYMDFLKEYNTNITAVNGRPGTNQSIGRGSFVGNYTIKPSFTGSTIDDTDIQKELTSQIAAGNLPAPDDNTLYMTSFPPGATITLTQGGSTAQSCREFCAYHSSSKVGAANLYYGVLPDFGGACSDGCGTNDEFSNYTSAASHEITEAITDSQVGDVPGDAVDYPMAWYDSTNGEIGDICVGTNGQIKDASGKSYMVQGEWSNLKNACVTGP